MASVRFALAFVGFVLSTACSAQQVFFGNLHSHTSYSDGVGTPEEAFLHARDRARMDFLAITEHNHAKAEGTGDRKDGKLIAKTPTLYTGPRADALIPTANRLTKDGKFVALYGQEFSTISSGNHVNVFDVADVITVPNGDFKQLLTWLESHLDSSDRPAVVQFNHPGLHDEADEYGADDFVDQAEWIAKLDPRVELIEVLNGPAMGKTNGVRSANVQEADYLHYLDLGFRVGPSVGQDNHYRTWGTLTDARVAVVADSLTKRNVLDALRNRHVYATEDRNLRIIGRVNGQLMGDRITTLPNVGGELQIEVSIKDDDEDDASYRVEVLSAVIGKGANSTPAKVVSFVGNTSGFVKVEGVHYQEPNQYVLLKVTQTNEDGPHDRAWTAPVWFESASPAPVTPAAKIRIVSLLPDPRVDDTQNEAATLRNLGIAPADLTGWRLRDLAGKTWNLDSLGTLGPNQEAIIKRSGQPMALNNTGDTVSLINPDGTAVQTVTYGAVQEDQVVPVAH